MKDLAEVSQELERLITLGHQDTSLITALQRKFPGITDAEVQASFDAVKANRVVKTEPAP